MRNLKVFALGLVIPLMISPESLAQNDAGKREQTVVTTPMPIVQENTVAACEDEVDNDNDGHVDCDDQDCEVYAICVPSQRHAENTPDRIVKVKIVDVQAQHAGPPPERGHQCRDRIDNNGDGYIDCHEESCQRYAYCRRQMYTVPEPKNKAPGFFLNFGIGMAFPNFRGPSAETNVPAYGESIPFDPDMGVMFSMKTGVLFLKWLGLAANFNFGATVAGNNHEFIMSRDDPSEYKYQGGQAFAHIGGVVRFQWPFCRFVPYLDVGFGYSMMDYQWYIYDAANSWDDINEDITYGDSSGITGTEYLNSEKYRHFTLALEPGFDFFVSARRFAIGLKAWLPVYASHHPGTDNLGVMFSMTYTPRWRERPVLRPEYERTKVK